jgi:hypothetical protein
MTTGTVEGFLSPEFCFGISQKFLQPQVFVQRKMDTNLARSKSPELDPWVETLRLRHV